MAHMSEIFRTLPDHKMAIVTEAITNAGLIKHSGGDYKKQLILKKNSTIGKRHRIYKQLIELSDLEFDVMLSIMCE